VTVASRNASGGVISIASDEDGVADLPVVTRDRLEPRDLDRLAIPEGAVLVSAKWLSPRTRDLLRERGAAFIDSTGNAELVLRRPGLYVRTDGADRDPDPRPRAGPTLRGPGAWSLLRTLVEVTPPYTAGELAAALSIDDGYVSRSLKVLGDELLIERRPRGPVTAVDWEAVLRRLTDTYSLLDSNETSTWIATAGPEQLIDDLAGAEVRKWALTGSFVASSIAPVAAPELAVIYTDDPERLAKNARLLPATSGANVILARPYDPIVYLRGRRADGIPFVSVAQAATDLLTGPGRMPQEGESLVAWMRRNEQRWMSTELKG
jgi:DNA-binding transcriptional ArsR family regulator